MTMVLLDTERTFTTPEQATYRYRVAGPLVRAWAFAIDAGLVMLAILAAWLVVLAATAMLGGSGAGFGIGAGLVLTFIGLWLAGGLVEWRWEGRTPGKRVAGIRVIGVDGLPAGLGACMLRTLLRYADAMPTVAMALGVMVCSGDFRRLGDLAAGTLVVHDDHEPDSWKNPADKEADTLAASLPVEVANVLDAAALRAIGAYVGRRRTLHPLRRTELANHLAGPLAQRLNLPPRTDPDLVLRAVHRRLAGDRADPVSTRGAAYLAQRQADWRKLEALVDGRIVERGHKGEVAPLIFARLYRAGSSDLALAEGFHVPERVTRRLHRLVANAHMRFHPRARLTLAEIRRLVLVDVPGRLYGDPCLRAAFIAFFGVFFGCAVLALAHPTVAESVLGTGYLDGLRDMYAAAPDKRSAAEAASMHGFYILNNVGISLACFASGIFLGVGSLVFLAFNGVVLGLVFGSMAAGDPTIRTHFFSFVTAHGPFELTGIALAGTAGLRLGLGLVESGGLPRVLGLQRSARRAAPILAVAAVTVAAAAPIEAWVSPSALPVAAKQAVAVISSLLLLTYLAGCGWHGHRTLSREAAHAP